MNKKRLKEIKDSIDLQYELWKECENTILIDEEKELYNEVIRLHKIIKEVRETLDDKRSILTTHLLNGEYCNYEELLYQVDEEIRKILDKVGDSSN